MKSRREHWLERKQTHQWIRGLLLMSCIGLAIGDIIYRLYFETQHELGHAPLFYENWPCFYGIMGFAAYSLIVTTAKGVRRVLARKENYYG